MRGRAKQIGRRWGILALVVLVALTGCGLKSSKETDAAQDEASAGSTESTESAATNSDSGTLVTLAPTSVELQLTTNLNRATNAAQVWHDDAVLTYVSVDIPASLAPASGNEVYVFGSASDPLNWWTYSIAQESDKFVRAIIPKEDYLGADVVPVNTQYWQMNYVEALQLAETNGGSSFRSSHEGTRVTTFLSQRSPRGWLWWSVEYTAPSGDVFTLLVNPFRGEVVDETGNELAPPKGSTTSSSGTDAI